MARLLCFLQNAWSPFYAGGEWPRENWLYALADSQSGKRLRGLVADPGCCWNTTPIVGATPSSVVPPDDQWITSILATELPDAVIACGKQAHAALSRLWAGPLLCVPHPAWRVLRNETYRKARALLDRGLDRRFNSRLAVRQAKDGTVTIEGLG